MDSFKKLKKTHGKNIRIRSAESENDNQFLIDDIDNNNNSDDDGSTRLETREIIELRQKQRKRYYLLSYFCRVKILLGLMALR